MLFLKDHWGRARPNQIVEFWRHQAVLRRPGLSAINATRIARSLAAMCHFAFCLLAVALFASRRSLYVTLAIGFWRADLPLAGLQAGRGISSATAYCPGLLTDHCYPGDYTGLFSIIYIIRLKVIWKNERCSAFA